MTRRPRNPGVSNRLPTDRKHCPFFGTEALWLRTWRSACAGKGGACESASPLPQNGAEERTEIVKLFLILSSKGRHSPCTDEKQGNQVTFCTKERTRPKELRDTLELLLLLEPAAAWRAGGSRGASGKGSESGPQELGRGRDQGKDLLASLGFARREQVRSAGAASAGQAERRSPFLYIIKGSRIPLELRSRFVYYLYSVFQPSRSSPCGLLLQTLTALLFYNIGLEYLLSVV